MMIEKSEAWVMAVVKCSEKGWKCICGWVFEFPSGSRHDLSAFNLDMLEYIEDIAQEENSKGGSSSCGYGNSKGFK